MRPDRYEWEPYRYDCLNPILAMVSAAAIVTAAVVVLWILRL